MQKIVTNRCYGVFGLSNKAIHRYNELKGPNLYKAISRDDPFLIQVVEEMGEDVNGKYAKLKITEIPDNIEWQIEDNDGLEWVAENHRKW